MRLEDGLLLSVRNARPDAGLVAGGLHALPELLATLVVLEGRLALGLVVPVVGEALHAERALGVARVLLRCHLRATHRDWLRRAERGVMEVWLVLH